MNGHPLVRLGLGCLAVFLLLCGLGATAAAAAPTVSTVVSGLDNPRDLAFGPGGQLYVAEAGHGGPSCIGGGPEGDLCLGLTSGISRIDLLHGTATRVVSGFASGGGDDGSAATGIDGISVAPDGTIYGVLTESSDIIPDGVLAPDLTAALQSEFGRLVAVSPSTGNWRTVADVGHHDYLWTGAHSFLVPDQFPDANPYGVFTTPGPFGIENWVVDAAANTLDHVLANGTIQVAAFVPNPPVSDSVPTCVDRGPDGALYIGELTGGGNTPGASIVWRFNGRNLQQWATGLTAVTGCGFGANGQFYATEFSTLGLDNAAPGTGALVRVPPHSTAPVTVVGGLSFPGGFAGGSDGSLYFSNWSIAPAVSGLGSVDRVTLGP